MQEKPVKPNFEFIALMASLMAIVALTIDAILPAMTNIGVAINSLDPTDNQALITMIFLGIGVGQLIFGPLSDSFGRKPIVYIGFLVFIASSIVCIFAPSLEVMIVGRILQGVGLSAARTMAISIIRDTYKGDYMAKIISFVVAFFILIPVVAPAIGKLILDFCGWQAIFYFQILFGLFITIWFWKRQPETLKKEHKIPFRPAVFVNGVKEFVKYKETVACTLVSGLITGAFLVYLSSAQYVFENQYNLKESFPYIFAALAISIGLSTLANGTLVMRFGMRKLALTALIGFTCLSLVYVFIFWNATNPSITVLIGFLSLTFFFLGFIWGNLRSIAMEPIGHIAGIGAAINGFLSTVISVPIATFIGIFIADTVLPMFIGLGVCGLLSLVLFSIYRKPASQVALER